MFSTVCLEQTVLISDFLCVLNLDLKLFYSIRLSLNTDPTCQQRASEVTTVWRYRNSIIIVIVIIIIIIIIIIMNSV